MASHPPLPLDLARCHSILAALTSADPDSKVSAEAVAWRRAVMDTLRSVGFLKPSVVPASEGSEVRHG